MTENEKSVLDLFAELRKLEAQKRRLDKKHMRSSAKTKKLESKFDQMADECSALEERLCAARPKTLTEAACQAELLAQILDSARDFETAGSGPADRPYGLSLNILFCLAGMAGHEITSHLRPVKSEEALRA